MAKTLVIGASENPERYAYKAIQKLLAHGHEVKALALRKGEVNGVTFETEQVPYTDIDTVTMYVGPKNQPVYYDYIEALKPRRVIFNPGTENEEFMRILRENDIDVEVDCTLVMLHTRQY